MTSTRFFHLSGGWYGRNTTGHLSSDQRLADYLPFMSVNEFQTEMAGVEGWETLCGKTTKDVLLSEYDPADKRMGVCAVCKRKYGVATGTKQSNVRLRRIDEITSVYEGEGFTYQIRKKYVKRNGWRYFYTTDHHYDEDQLKRHMDPENGWAHRLEEVREIIANRINREGAK